MLLRALARRCPLCGARDIFVRWGQMVERCPGCGYAFEREEGYWVGAMIVNLGFIQVGFMALFITTMVLTWPDVPWIPLAVASFLLVVVLPVWFYPRSKTLWVWLDLRIHPYGAEERPPYQR